MFFCLAAIFVAVQGTLALAQELDKTYSFDIQGRSLARALNQVATQTRHQLLFSHELVGSRDVQSISGKYTLIEVLNLLLDGTGLAARLTERGVIVINPASRDNNREEDDMKGKKNILALIVGALAGAASAQDGTAEGGAKGFSEMMLDEVVVTAQKRSESMRDVPVAISAFSGDMMKVMGVKDAGDLADITPGFSAGSQAGSNKNYYIRGVGTNDFHLTAAPAVGQYFDEVTLTSGFHARAALFDMERVEILKGPQNTLFGLNTTGGAVNYISRKPEIGAGTTGNFNVEFGSNSLLNIETAIGFDITNTVAARFAFQMNSNDGAYSSVTNGKKYGDDDMKIYRLAFLWQPTSETGVTLNIHGMENDNNGSILRALGTREADGSGARCAQLDPGVPDFDKNTNCLSRDGGATGFPAVDPSTDDWTKTTQPLGMEDLSTKGFYLKVDHDFGWSAFNSTTAWDNLDFRTGDDIDGGPSLGLLSLQSDDRDTFQQELRLMSPVDDKFRWITGVYYLDEEADSYTGVRSSGVQFGLGNRLPNIQLEHTKENTGVYFQGEYDFTQALTLTIGARWSYEEILADYLPSSPDVTGTDVNTLFWADDIDALVSAQNPGTPGFDGNGYEISRQVQQKLTNEDVGYTVKLDWKFASASMLYLSYSKGFKGSAPDIRAAFALVPVSNIEEGLERARLAPESLEVWELGYKGEFWKDRIQFDGAVFRSTYNDLQQFITAQGVPTLDNAPESEITGFDGNLKFANDSGLFLQAGLSLLNTEVTDAKGSLFIKGAELANSPEISYSFLASQDFQVGYGILTLMAHLNHTGESVKTTLTTGNDIRKSFTADEYTLINASATYRFGNDRQYALSVFGKNLTDEHYCSNISITEGEAILEDGVDPFSVTHTLVCRVTNSSTRTIGASFSYKF